MTLTKRSRVKTEHSGAKNGGGYWGSRAEAKRLSKKHRRENSKKEIRQEFLYSKTDMMRNGNKTGKTHPWRLCPTGEHAVRTHALHAPPSRRHPTGFTTTRHFHCARNPSGKDQIYPVEMQEIANEQFSKLKNKPCPLSLRFRNGAKYDDLIAGWVQYWNDVIGDKDPLSSNVVKALIASESGFRPKLLADKKNANSARGLTQILNDTRKILGDESGELKDHYVSVTREELNDPNVNICAGVRWLFQKRSLASGKLGRPATWEETIAHTKVS
ncbi:MAG: lytic transglycosylase domain-containing protein [Deltaproteobacteria bacterium]|nr:lytic transglycosylase domain-containing protein [Deltaproteobacteria bacterium]